MELMTGNLTMEEVAGLAFQAVKRETLTTTACLGCGHPISQRLAERNDGACRRCLRVEEA